MNRLTSFVAAALLSLPACAQQLEPTRLPSANVGLTPMKLEVVDGLTAQSRHHSAIRRSQATASSPTAFYKRPRGTFFSGVDDQLRGFWGYVFAVYPPYANIQFENASKDPSATTWYSGSHTIDADASGNITTKFSMPENEGYFASVPLLVNGTDSFTIAYGANINYPVDCGFTLFSLSGSDFGFSYGYGDNQLTYHGNQYSDSLFNQFAVYQIYDKPIGSVSINKISLVLWSEGVDFKSDSLLTAYIYNVVDTTVNGQTYKLLGDSILGTFTFVPDSVKIDDAMSGGTPSGSRYGVATLYSLADDGLGGKIQQTVSVVDQFAVLLTGFRGHKLQFGYCLPPAAYITNNAAYSAGTQPAVYDSSIPEGAHVLCVNRKNQVADLSFSSTIYPIIIFHGHQNYAEFIDGYTTGGTSVNLLEFTAPTAGGYTQAQAEEPAYLYTSLPWKDVDGFDNYTVEIDYCGEEPWLNQHEDESDASKKFDVTTNYWASMGFQLLKFYADPLPAGKTGRHAFVKIDADGYKSNTIVIRQGDDSTPLGITAVSSEANGGDNRMFNLSGQQVGKSYKGIVIKNGKKYINR